MSLVTLPHDVDVGELIEVLDRDAAVIVKDALNTEQLSRLEAELSPFIAAGEQGRNTFAGFATKRIGALLARSETCRDLAVDPLVQHCCRSLLGPHGDDHQLHFTQAVSIGPDEAAQALHRDRAVWGDYLPRSIETQLSTIWALTDFTAANGATQVVPGSQHWPDDRKPLEDEVLSAEMSLGSVLIYTGSVLHGGGANTTGSNRVGVLLHYTLNWLRQEENQYLSCPPEVARDLSPQLRELIGYSRGGPVLGFYSTPSGPGEGVELADPAKMFRD